MDVDDQVVYNTDDSQPESVSILENYVPAVAVDEPVPDVEVSDKPDPVCSVVDESGNEERNDNRNARKNLSIFFSSHKMTTVQGKTKSMKQKKKYHTIVGNLAKKSNQDALKSQNSSKRKKFKTPWAITSATASVNPQILISENQPKKMSDGQKANTIQRKKSRNNSKPKQTKTISKRNRPQPSTSGISKKGGPIPLDVDTDN